MAYWLRDRGFEAYARRTRRPARYPAPVAGAARGAPSPPIASPWNARSRRCGTRAFAATRRGALLPDRQLGRGGGLGYVVLLLGGSAATLGLIGFLNTIPNLIFGLPAGALADRYDRRKLLLIFQGANMVIAVVLAVPWATDSLSVPLMGAIAVIGGSLGTLSFPAFQGMLASTVPPGELESAVAINSLSLQLARFVGPAIAGVLLAESGPTAVFAVNAVSFLLVAVALLPGSRALAANAAAGLAGSMREAFATCSGSAASPR